MDLYGVNWRGLWIRTGYKTFPAIRARINQLIRAGLPCTLKGGDNQTNFLTHENGGNLMLTVVDAPQKLDDFLGQEFTEITVEEAGQWSWIDRVIDKMQGCLRSAAGVPCSLFMTTNPGGPGHAYLKREFVAPEPRGYKLLEKYIGETVKVKLSSMFIPANVYDNPILVKNDPMYVARLESIKDPNLRAAWLYGDWNVVAGGFFADLWDARKHIVPMFRPPDYWSRLFFMDWGSAKPFYIGWAAIADGSRPEGVPVRFPYGSIVQYAEWYGCTKDMANTGIRMESPAVAERALQMEKDRSDASYYWDRVGDPAMYDRQDGPSVAEKMADKGLVVRRGDNSRLPGWEEVRNRLSHGEDRLPLLYFTENCRSMIDILPTTPRDENNWEDVDTDSEDHPPDALRYGCMSRPRIQRKSQYEEQQQMAKLDEWQRDQRDYEEATFDPEAGY